MKHNNVILTVASLLSVLFGTFHLADDITRGMSPGGLPNLIAVVIWVVWLYGTLVLAGRRSGYVIILVGSLLLMAVPVIRLRGPGVGFGTTRSGGFFFIWTLLRVRRDRALLRHSLGARTVESATGPSPGIIL
jgi:hypothetical protein